MPLREKTLDLDEEVQRLEAQKADLIEAAAALDEDNPALAGLEQRGQSLDDRLDGVRWARDEAYDDPAVPMWDADVDTVTLGGLTGGEYGTLEDDVRTAASKRETESASGLSRVYMVARGTVDAPYQDDDHSDVEAVAAAQQLPYQFLKWAEAHINQLTTVGSDEGNSRSFSAAVAAKRQEMSTDEPS